MRRAVRTLVLCVGLATLALASAACGNKKAVQAIQKFTDEMCECEDAECARGVDEDRLAWIEENPRPRGTESDRQKVEEALEDYQECREEALSGGDPQGGGQGAQ